MDCPKCDGRPLERLTLHFKDRRTPGPRSSVRELLLDQCGGCSGVWFDPGELEQYLDSGVSAPSDAQVSPERHVQLDSHLGRCPRCKATMEWRPAPADPATAIERCRQCRGIWVDGGELSRLGRKDAPLQDKLLLVFGDLLAKG